MSSSDGSAAGFTRVLVLPTDFFGVFFAGAFFAAALLLLGFVPVVFLELAFFAAPFFSSVEGWASTALVTGSAGTAAFIWSVFDFLGTGMGSFCRTPFRSCAAVCKRIFAKRLPRARDAAYAARVRHFVVRWAVTTVAVLVASALVSGIRYESAGSLIAAALLLGILNAFVRPLLLILSAPLILLSLGLFILVINALMLRLVPTFVPGFYVDRFSSAFWGAIIISLISWLLSAFFRGSDGRVRVLTHHTQIKRVEGRVVEPKS
jgi:putative membrane protein